jgi:hypothetical protein
MGKIVGIVAVLMVFGLIGQSCSGGEEDGDGAIAYCHQFVEQQLKLPDTADFPSFPHHQVAETGTQQWRVSAWVEAENSFGGTVRTDWSCEISYDEAAGEWTLVDLSGL